MVSSNLGGADAQVHNVLNNDETEWLAEEGRTEEQGFVLRTRGCERKITGVRIQNAAKPHASNHFGISSARGLKEPWNKLLKADLEENVDKVTFHLAQSVLTRFIRFEVLRNNSVGGGGLRLLSFTTGEVLRKLSHCHQDGLLLKTQLKKNNNENRNSSGAAIYLILK